MEAITAAWLPEETFMCSGQTVGNADINDRQAQRLLLVLLGSLSPAHRGALSMYPIHPSLSGLTQGHYSHFLSELKLMSARDEKAVEPEV